MCKVRFVRTVKAVMNLYGSFIDRAAAQAFELSLPPETNHHMMKKKLIRTSMMPRTSGLLRKFESNECKTTSIINLTSTSIYIFVFVFLHQLS